MIVREGPGDLLKSKMQTLVIPVNTVGAMGAGLAYPIKMRHPSLFLDYGKFCREGKFKIDTFLLKRISPTKKILLFPTKKHWQNPSKIEWIKANLEKFARLYDQHHIESVAFPAIGCGHGNLEWDQVKPLMYQYLDPLPIKVEIVLRQNDGVCIP